MPFQDLWAEESLDGETNFSYNVFKVKGKYTFYFNVVIIQGSRKDTKEFSASLMHATHNDKRSLFFQKLVFD